MKIDQSMSAYSKENVYDFDNNIILHEYPQMIADRLGGGIELKDKSLLELGLGHGYSALEFKGLVGGRHTVLEGDSAIIEKFNHEHPGHGIQIIETYFEDFETEGKYDIIVAGFVLEHVADPLQIIKKYMTYLDENGRMFIAVPNAEALNRRLGYEAGLISALGKLSQMDIELGHKRYFTVSSLSKMIMEAEMKLTGMEGIYLKPFTTRQILSLDLDGSILKAMCKVGRKYPELSLGILAECVK